MKTLLKNIARPLYYYIKNKNEREFNRLLDKWGKYKRYTKVENVEFLDYIFDIPDLPSFVWQFKEIFVDEIYNFNTNNKQPIIFDCGANVGTSCLYFKKKFPNSKIKAFEADPMIADILKSNLFKNKINDVEFINKAVWIDDKGVDFSCEGADGGSIFAKNDKIKINSVRLKDFLESNQIDMLKIDIEGAEHDVLLDCKDFLKNVKNIFVEYHSLNNSYQKLADILSVFENNNIRYYIENVSKRKQPFINRAKDQNMDLQLNIFGVNEY